MDEKVRVQLSYEPNDDISQRAVIMLESAMRSKSQLVALALYEFAEKYGFQIDSTEEIKAVIKNYEYLSRAMVSEKPLVHSPTQIPISGFQKKEKPKKEKKPKEPVSQSNKMIPSEQTSAKNNIVNDESPAEEKNTSTTSDFDLNEGIIVSDRAMQSMNNVLAMFSQS